FDLDDAVFVYGWHLLQATHARAGTAADLYSHRTDDRELCACFHLQQLWALFSQQSACRQQRHHHPPASLIRPGLWLCTLGISRTRRALLYADGHDDD